MMLKVPGSMPPSVHHFSVSYGVNSCHVCHFKALVFHVLNTTQSLNKCSYRVDPISNSFLGSLCLFPFSLSISTCMGCSVSLQTLYILTLISTLLPTADNASIYLRTQEHTGLFLPHLTTIKSSQL